MKPSSPKQTRLCALLMPSRKRGAWKESLRLIFSKILNPPQPVISTPTPMQIAERFDGSVIVISISGPIDSGTSSQLRAYLQLKVTQQAQDILVDFASVTRIESTGLATFVEFLRNTQRFGARLVLATLSSRVQSAFEIMRLDQVFSIYADETAALNALKIMCEKTSLLGSGAWVRETGKCLRMQDRAWGSRYVHCRSSTNDYYDPRLCGHQKISFCFKAIISNLIDLPQNKSKLIT